jgi:crotonobetainyl-CoA hydratase
VPYEFIGFERRDHIAFVTLNRPEVMNAIHPPMDDELCHAWQTVRDDPDIWVAVLAGAGERAFTVGADLKWWGQASLSRSQHWDLSLKFGGLVNFQLWKPVIAAIHGYCLGGGLEIVLACDLVVAATTTRMGLPEVRTVGAPPGSGGVLRLPRQIPLKRAMQILLTGEPIGAEEALHWGLVNTVVARADVMGEATSLAETICRNSPLAVRATKELAMRGLEVPLHPATAWDLYAQVNMQLYDSTDFTSREATRAFLEKRAPRWQGR